jgi:hypothetical protein
MFYSDPVQIKGILEGEGWEDGQYEIHPNGVVDFFEPIDWYMCGIKALEYQIGFVAGMFNISGNPLTSLHGCPYRVEGDLSIRSLQVTSLEFIPKYVAGDVYCDNNQNPSVCIPLLLGEYHKRIWTGMHEVDKILFKDRINGKMPRELIPGKINQLRDLDGTDT